MIFPWFNKITKVITKPKRVWRIIVTCPYSQIDKTGYSEQANVFGIAANWCEDLLGRGPNYSYFPHYSPPGHSPYETMDCVYEFDNEADWVYFKMEHGSKVVMYAYEDIAEY